CGENHQLLVAANRYTPSQPVCILKRMKAQIFIGFDRIGETNLNIIDETMGVLGGQVTSFPEYEKYRFRVQQETESKGGANVEEFPFSIVTKKGSVL
ncbi:MAG: hypothetical protein C4329_15685, partial [Chitinophagaceae bacterium]